MNENMQTRNELLVKWLRIVMYVALASIVNSIISFMPFVPAALTTWISRGIMAAMIVCMFQLASANKRYKTAGILRAVMLACALITAYAFGSTILTLTASIVSIIAVYQEYTAHSELVAEKDKKLSGKWHSLFIWSILASLLLSFGATVVAVIFVLGGLEDSASRISGIVVGLLSIPQLILEVAYVVYIKKMVGYFQSKEEVSGNDL